MYLYNPFYLVAPISVSGASGCGEVSHLSFKFLFIW